MSSQGQDMTPSIAILPYLSLPPSPVLIGGIDAVFFEASNTKSFADDAARAAFRQRWLGRFLEHDAEWAYIALAEDGGVAGYLVGATDDPARSERFSDLAYFKDFAALTARYPAQLHVNLAPRYRGHGTGERLIETFVADLEAAGTGGVHVITSRGARNVRFYERCGFHEAGASGAGAGEVVFLARDL